MDVRKSCGMLVLLVSAVTIAKDPRPDVEGAGSMPAELESMKSSSYFFLPMSWSRTFDRSRSGEPVTPWRCAASPSRLPLPRWL